MPAEAVVHASEQGHWYDRQGRPMYDVDTKGYPGKTRPATLRDARTMFLVPGVSTIIRCAAAPGLERWKQDQVLLAALTLPRDFAETDLAYCARVQRDAQEEGRAAAERGTEVHAIIERHYAWVEHADEGATFVTTAGQLLDTVIDAVADRYGYLRWHAERSFAHPLGFGGKADLFWDGDRPILIDFKTKDFAADTPAALSKKLAWDEHVIQLAAYREGLGRPEALCANVFVTRQEPWLVHVHEWPEEQVQRGWRMFVGLLDYWKAKSNYDPSWQEQADAVA